MQFPFFALSFFVLLMGCAPRRRRPQQRPTATPLPTDVFDYFLEISLMWEFAEEQQSPVVYKWLTDPAIRVHGQPSESDIAELRRVVSELNGLVDTIDISVTSSTLANINMHFIPKKDIPFETYHEDNAVAFFRIWWEGNAIFKAEIYISSDLSTNERRHNIREELTQSLGLRNDSPAYPDSIFYERNGISSSVTEYADVDRACIALLYRDDVKPGMTREELREVIGKGVDQ